MTGPISRGTVTEGCLPVTPGVAVRAHVLH